MATQIVEGFSLTNRLLLYASILLSPAQFYAGLGSNCPSNLGFLAYNIYTQVKWYKSIQGDDPIHALSLILPHFNLMYVLSYLGGISSGNVFMGVLLGLGTAGVIILNTITAWVGWAAHQPQGYGVYQFFFFGWRTIDEGWHKFFLLWQIFDSLLALSAVGIAIQLAIEIGLGGDEMEPEWWAKYLAVPAGIAGALLVAWPLILWTELIMARNQLESETDMAAVWLFVAQVVTMLIPSCGLKRSSFD